MNARRRALTRYCEEQEDYIQAIREEFQVSWDKAVDYAVTHDDEYFRALFQEELEREDLTAGE